jgi:OOP family OmpA-OmpF porin
MTGRTRMTIRTGALMILWVAALVLPCSAAVQIPRPVQAAVDHATAATDKLERKAPAESDAADGSDARQDSAVWVNYDFVPGSRVIWAEDFTRDRVGDFPRRVKLLRGNFEVAEWQGQHWLRTAGDGRIAIELPAVLPARFTMEFDYNGGGRAPGRIYFTDDERGRPHVFFYYGRGGLSGAGADVQTRMPSLSRNRVMPVRIMVDRAQVKVYQAATRVANAPDADLGRSHQIVLSVAASQTHPVMLGNFRIAAGGPALYDALSGEGRVATRGIVFDTGSHSILPESTPTLKEIGEMLRQHPDLRLRIEGHTDNVGDAASNQALSERRAEAVRQYLSEHFQIDHGRLESTGRGETEPVDSNDTPEGRQNNRRVELIRLQPIA